MFLNLYLFFSNTLFLSICSLYLRYLILGKHMKDLNKYKNKKEELKKKDRIDTNDQLEYVRNNDEIKDLEFKLLGWKFLSLLVALFMALTIVKTEPLIIFGIHLNLILMIISMVILNHINILILDKLGVANIK